MHKDTTYQGSDRQDFYRHGKKKKKKKEKEKKEKKENKQTKRRPRLGLPIGNPVKRKNGNLPTFRLGLQPSNYVCYYQP